MHVEVKDVLLLNPSQAARKHHSSSDHHYIVTGLHAALPVFRRVSDTECDTQKKNEQKG